jgi:hypothetical protein
MGADFHIFITADGHARYVETVGNLAAARKRLKQEASKFSGDASCIQSRAASWNSLSANGIFYLHVSRFAPR